MNRLIRAVQNPSLGVLVDVTTSLFSALLQAKIDTDLAAALSDLLADGQLDTPALQSVAARVTEDTEAAERRHKIALFSAYALAAPPHTGATVVSSIDVTSENGDGSEGGGGDPGGGDGGGTRMPMTGGRGPHWPSPSVRLLDSMANP